MATTISKSSFRCPKVPVSLLRQLISPYSALHKPALELKLVTSVVHVTLLYISNHQQNTTYSQQKFHVFYLKQNDDDDDDGWIDDSAVKKCLLPFPEDWRSDPSPQVG